MPANEVAPLPPENENPLHEVARQLSETILKEDSLKITLSETDLRDKGVLGAKEALSAYIARSLCFDRSLQEDAIKLLSEELPPPFENFAYQSVLSEQEEMELRKNCFDVETMLWYPPTEILDLTRLVYAKVDSLYNENSDLEKIEEENNFTNTIDSQLEDQIPGIMDFIDEKHYWSIPDPSGEKFFVVTDAESNAEITSYVFSNQNLLKYFIEEKIIDIQKKLEEKLRIQISHLAREKNEQIFEELLHINKEMRMLFFQRLFDDAKDTTVELIHLSRNYSIRAVFEGEQKDPGQSKDTQVIAYKITRRDDQLTFVWTDQKSVVINQKDNAASLITTTQYRAEAQVVVKDGKLEYTSVNAVDASHLKNIFNLIDVMTYEEYTNPANDKMGTLPRIVAALKATTSSVEFVQLIRELALAHYPAHEFLININNKVPYQIEESFVTPPPTSMWN